MNKRQPALAHHLETSSKQLRVCVCVREIVFRGQEGRAAAFQIKARM